MREERNLAVALRAKGMTYAEIQKKLGIKIPKATMSHWCKDVPLSLRNQKRIKAMSQENLKRGRRRAQEVLQELRIAREQRFRIQNQSLLDLYKVDLRVRKITLAILHLAEGHKNKASVAFGNSDTGIISMFMELMRTVYEIDETKFRITVQCRADQDPEQLKNYWSRVTGVSPKQFYKPQIDSRTIGKPTKKPDYKGVCRIDYFSALIDQELKYIARNLEKR